MKIRTALLAATILSLPVAVNAETVTGLYVSGGAGVNWMSNVVLKSLTDVYGGQWLSSSGNFNTNTGFVGVGALGYGLGNGLRLEAEVGYRANNLHATSSPNVGAHGQEQKLSAMGNILYDIPVAWPVTPYVGAGIGYGWSNLKGVNFYTTTPIATTTYINSERGSFAYQVIAGVSYPIKGVPGLSVTGEARFFSLAGDRNYNASSTAVVGENKLGVGVTAQFNEDYNYSVQIGLRYAFNHATPAPVVVAPPPAAISKNYLVFFDWDKADLTARAKEIIAEAAANSKKVAVTKIAVNGYTDLSGTPAYNQGLSVRRAKAVAAELVKDGVPAKEIGIQGFGEKNPLVPTAQGVREPQNRRVEIIFN